MHTRTTVLAPQAGPSQSAEVTARLVGLDLDTPSFVWSSTFNAVQVRDHRSVSRSATEDPSRSPTVPWALIVEHAVRIPHVDVGSLIAAGDSFRIGMAIRFTHYRTESLDYWTAVGIGDARCWALIVKCVADAVYD